MEMETTEGAESTEVLIVITIRIYFSSLFPDIPNGPRMRRPYETTDTYTPPLNDSAARIVPNS